MLIVLSVLWRPTIFPPCTCTVALKQSQGDPNRCGMVVLSWVHQGLFSLKVISSRSHITTHFDVIAYSCGWPISERRSLVDIWERAWPYFHLFKVLLVQCNLGDTTIKNHNIRKTWVKTVGHFKGLLVQGRNKAERCNSWYSSNDWWTYWSLAKL